LLIKRSKSCIVSLLIFFFLIFYFSCCENNNNIHLQKMMLGSALIKCQPNGTSMGHMKIPCRAKLVSSSFGKKTEMNSQHRLQNNNINLFTTARGASMWNGPPIGIDLGTTNSCVAILEEKTPRVLENAEE